MKSESIYYLLREYSFKSQRFAFCEDFCDWLYICNVYVYNVVNALCIMKYVEVLL